MKKKILITAAVLAAALSLTGCKESLFSSSGESGSETVNIWTAKDDDIVAYASGEGLSDELKKYYEISFKDFYSEYSFTIDNYGIDETSSDYQLYAEYYRQNIIEMLANEKIILKKAEELGLDKLTEEESEQINTKYDESLASWYATFEEKASAAFPDSSEVTSDELLEKEKELFCEYLAGYGLSEEIFLKWQYNSFVENKVIEYLCKDITVTDTEIDDYVNGKITEAKETYENNSAAYEYNTDLTKYWLPDGARYIKYIALNIGSADYAEIKNMRNESDADNDAIDKIRDEKLSEIKAKAEEALSKCKEDGSSFDDILKEYSNDYEEGDEESILILKDTTSLDSQLYDAIFALENPGDISELIATDRGYFILKYEEEAKITDEDIQVAKLNAELILRSDKENEAANEAMEKWIAEVAYKYDYEKLNFPDPAAADTSADSSDVSDDADTDSSDTSE